MLMFDPKHFHPANLSRTSIRDVLCAHTGTRFDLVMTLEVAEHLPFERAETFVGELTDCADVVLFSAATPYQYGVDHVNEQWPEFWATIFRARGFSCFDIFRDSIWNAPDVDWWYAQNTFLYVKDGTASAEVVSRKYESAHSGLSKIHPENFLVNLLTLRRRHGPAAFKDEEADYRTVSQSYIAGSLTVPPLAAVTRAKNEGLGNAAVFPNTRIELSNPEQEQTALEARLRKAEEQKAITEQHLNMLQNNSEILVREFASLRQTIEGTLAERTHSERTLVEALNEQAIIAKRLDEERKNAEMLRSQLRSSVAAQEKMSAQLATIVERHRDELGRRNALIAALKKRHAQEQDAHSVFLNEALSATDAKLRAAQAEVAALSTQIDHITSSTVWRVSRPLRAVASHIPVGARRAIRGAAKLAWWTVTLQLRERLTERNGLIQASGAMTQFTPVPSQPLLAPTANFPAPDVATSTDLDATDLDATDLDTVDLDTPTHRISFEHKGHLGMLSEESLILSLDRLDKLEIFDQKDYLDANRDVEQSDIDPRLHAIAFGVWEGRKLFRRERIARVLGSTRSTHSSLDSTLLLDSFNSGQVTHDLPEVGVYVSSHGNIFMREIAEGLVHDLQTAGARASLHDELSSIENRPAICIFVAPHEFFTLGKGREWARDDVLTRSFMYTTEQLQTSWFNLSLPFVLPCRGVIDIVDQTSQLFRDASIPSLHIEPSIHVDVHGAPESALESGDLLHPLYRILPPQAKAIPSIMSPLKDRAIDVCFFGAETPTRESFFARHASFLADYETFFNYRKSSAPIRKGSNDSALTRIAKHVSGHSKISLNLHREEFGYFEWHRIVKLAIGSGSVVVSEPCLPHPVFKPGIHYFEEIGRHVSELVEWLVRSDDGQRKAEAVRLNALDVLNKTSSAKSNGIQIAQFVTRHMK
ncbi:hypothetical protein WK17_15675 [Burkholderia multivorans]|nr:hypothetical protein WK17_15675 [Burkholderia multivorans]